MNLTNKNLDRLTSFLTSSKGASDIANRIPTGAHIFYGSNQDRSLTEKNLKLASKILLGMTLGYVEDAPLVMIVERKQDEFQVIHLADEVWKGKAQKVIESFQEQNQQEVAHAINL